MTKRKILWPLIFLALTTSGALAIVGGHDTGGPATTETTVSRSALPTPATTELISRNLALQPEALKLSRRIGRRFSNQQRSLTIADGTLKTESGIQAVRITRRQTDRGERVEIQTNSGALTWNEDEGAAASGSLPSDIERLLIERLALDSADQFVLAELRGAQYSTVAQNVRPTNADETYSGPLWDIVRIDDPERNPDKKPLSKWRLYYIDTKTGLIDKVVSEIRGHRVEASFFGWSEQNGEKVPARIVWKINGQVSMEIQFTAFTLNAVQGAK